MWRSREAGEIELQMRWAELKVKDENPLGRWEFPGSSMDRVASLERLSGEFFSVRLTRDDRLRGLVGLDEWLAGVEEGEEVRRAMAWEWKEWLGERQLAGALSWVGVLGWRPAFSHEETWNYRQMVGPPFPVVREWTLLRPNRKDALQVTQAEWIASPLSGQSESAWKSALSREGSGTFCAQRKDGWPEEVAVLEALAGTITIVGGEGEVVRVPMRMQTRLRIRRAGDAPESHESKSAEEVNLQQQRIEEGLF